jgi:hypothetical protein
MLGAPTFPFVTTRLASYLAPKAFQAYYEAAESAIDMHLPYSQAVSAALPPAAMPVGCVLADALFSCGFVVYVLAVPLAVAGAAHLLAARK